MNIRITTFLAIVLALCTFSARSTFAKNKKEKMKLTAQQAAPLFNVTDVFGQKIDMSSYRGKKVLLCFHRFAGCPVCNLRFHELERRADYFKEKGLVIIGIYESSPEIMRQYLDGQKPYTIMIPNPDESLYHLYNIERSTGKLMKGMFKGAMKMVMAGNKLFTKKVKHDGHINRIGADFLLDEKGNIIIAHYGQHLGDNLLVEEIINVLEHPAAK